jgi:hypothetical protein
VKVKLRIIESDISEITGWFFEKNGAQTSVIFRHIDKYSIAEMDLINKRDRDRFKKLLKRFKPDSRRFEQHVP